MKCVIPEISYHNRDPVLSLDFQLTRKPGEPVRLATAGSDTHVVIFSVSTDKEGKVELDCLSDLTRHSKAVNIVRWSPDGSLLASGDDESVIILWQLKQNTSDAPSLFDEDSAENKENWVVYKMIRSHLDDVYDLSWSPCSQFLLSGSVDNTAIITNVHKNQKVGHFSDSHGFVQGVAWNPKHNVLTTISSDRKCRFYNTLTKKLIGKTYKAFLNLEMDKVVRKKKTKEKSDKDASNPSGENGVSEVNHGAEVKEDTDKDQSAAAADASEATKEGDKDEDKGDAKNEKTDKNVRLFHDDTFKGFFRRLQWSLDGELLVVPSGVLETDTDAKLTHCTYVFTRIDLNKPAVCLPSRDKYTIAVRFCPVTFKLRPIKKKGVSAKTEGLEPWEMYQCLFALPYRFVYAVATQNAVMIYDTQQASPIARVSNIHYTGLTDLSWSPDGLVLIVSSSDGFCSIITFSEGELGEVYVPETPLDTPIETPAGTPDRKKKEEEGETAEQGFNEHGVKSPAQIHIKSNKEGGKSNPKRLKFITLSSPKADKRRPPANLETEDVAMDGMEEGMEGVEAIENDNGDLNLELEDTQQTKSEAPKQEKKRVPLISIPTGPNAVPNKPEGDAGGEERKGKRVELITLSSPKPKLKH